MYRRKIIYPFIFLVLISISTFAQKTKWYDPLALSASIHGQLRGTVGYARLPDEAEAQVRKPVWNLSRHTAGMELRFVTDAATIQVRFIPAGNIQMAHMPATGVSGLDLYMKNNGDLEWVRGSYSFGDTVAYVFRVNLAEQAEREFKLYLPLYNGVKNLEIGVPTDSLIKIIPPSSEKPIIVYGTSIAQGACASRPGMAWPAIVGRDLGRTVVNLGFSGNGRLEPEILEHISNTEAAVYVLDCLPNLVPSGNWTENEIKSRLNHAVRFLKEKHPDTPVLLVEHAGYTDSLTDRERDGAVGQVNTWVREVYKDLLFDSIEEIYLLAKEDIQLDMDATVDGTHPSDWGMQQIASAYVEILNEILEE
ncbi:SGNH/GDSL hydrolase family protein [Lunatibacter salilacus]|uniref:SGNH/GDSL hydrolase family protein n=1 Tax=Lunatibacter salilacus TaxID=2483804 RepID=UPI00131D6190|nr:SGNH/GDSL hydrolase family protein [Lunatibacter salilacus]